MSLSLFWYVLKDGNGMDVVTEAEIYVEARIGELFVVVRSKANHFLVAAGKDELAILYCCQSKEHHVAGSDFKVIHNNLPKINDACQITSKTNVLL